MNKNGINCNILPLVHIFNGNQLISEHCFGELDVSQESKQKKSLRVDDAVWACHCLTTPIPGSEKGIDLSLHFQLEHGSVGSAAVAVALDTQPWSVDNYVIIPGAVYDGNRFESLKKKYPPLFEPHEHRLGMPVTVTDIPRLGNNGDGPWRIEQTTGDASTPAIGFHDSNNSVGCWLLTQQKTRFGNLGLFVEESPERDRARLIVLSPCVRTEHQGSCNKMESQDSGVSWKAGDELTIKLRLYLFSAETKSEFLSYFQNVREDIKENKLASELPFSAAWDLLEEKYNRDNWCDERSYYSVGNRKTINEDWQIGWVGGCMVTHPLIFSGSSLSRQRALKNLDTILTKSQAPSGFFYGMGNGKEWFSDAFHEPHPCNMHLIRKSGDALYFLLKQFIALEQSNQVATVKESWKNAVRKLADAFTKLWKENGQLGQFVDVESGCLLVGGSTCGAIVPAALALAGRYFDNPVYLTVAEEIGAKYLEDFRRSGITTGGPGEILQAPDSESAFALLESMVVLHEETGGGRWLIGAEEVAQLCMTWCVSYDYEFPSGSLFQKLNMRTTGAVYANVQNKHAAPGICTLSGDSLLKLYRKTQNEVYLQQLCSIARSIPQYISRKDRPISPLLSGWINERVNMSDWEGEEMVGEVHDQSCWPEVSCMLTWLEVPGLYVRTDLGKVYCIDNIDVKVKQEQSAGMHVELHNPTRFKASVRMLVENQENLCESLDVSTLLKCPKLDLMPGETKTISFRKEIKQPKSRPLHKIVDVDNINQRKRITNIGRIQLPSATESNPVLVQGKIT